VTACPATWDRGAGNLVAGDDTAGRFGRQGGLSVAHELLSIILPVREEAAQRFVVFGHVERPGQHASRRSQGACG
jgi:hypothetical protein